jgi:hypothetical protein
MAVCALLSACGGGDASPPPVVQQTAATDTVAPTAVIVDNLGAATATAAVTFTITFSEDVGNSFSVDDIVVTGGTKGVFTRVDATHATLVVTPTADATGSIAVSIAALKFADLAGNGNGTTASAQRAYNTVPAPVVATRLVSFDEATAPVLTGFGGAEDATIVADPTNAANKVAKVVKSAAAADWAGTTVSNLANLAVAPIGFSASNKILTARVWSPDAGIAVRLKAENATDGTKTVETEATTTVAGGWQTLSFNFANQVPGTAALNLATTFNKLSIFFNFGKTGAQAGGAKTYYLDDLSYPTASGSGAGSGPTASVFASKYSQQSPVLWTSNEGGEAGRYIDGAVTTGDWWNGFAPNDATPSFYFGYGINVAAKPWGFGAYVKAPGNATASVAGLSNLKIAVWGNDELMNSHPTLTVIAKGPAVGACTPELKSTIAVSAAGVQTYTLPLSGFTLQTACSYATVPQAFAGGVTEIHVQVLGANVQYTTPADALGNYANGLNVGPISFN